MPRKLVLADPIADAPSRAQTAPAAFECTWSSDGLNSVWIHMTGDLDRRTTPQLERALAEPRLLARLVVLDLRHLASIDTRGVQAIVDASFRARLAGNRLVVLRGLANVDRVFTVTGSSYFVEIRDLGAFQPPAQLRRLDDGDRVS